MAAGRSHYDLLGVRADAPAEEIRRAFRALAKQAHPDAGGDAAAFLVLREAHDTLTDPERRAEYDRSLGLHTRPTSAGTTGAGWTGRQGGFTGDVEFPTWLRDIVDAPWAGAGAGSDGAGAGAGAPTGRGPAVRWWWPHGADRPPTVEGEAVVVTAGRVLARLDASSGHERWRAELATTVRGRPAPAGDVVAVATADGAVQGLDGADGRVRWRVGMKDRPVGTARVGDVVVVGAGRRLAGLDPATGRARWTSRLTGDAVHLLAAGDAVVVSTTGGTDAVEVRRGRHRWAQRVAPVGAVEPVWAAGAVWLVHGGRVVRVDADTGAVGPASAVGLAVVGLGAGDDRVHVSATGPTALVSLDGWGHVRATTRLPAVSLAPVTVAGTVVAVGTDGRLRLVDAHGAGVLGEGSLPVLAADAPVAAGGAVLLRDAEGTVWSVDPGDPVVAAGTA